MPIRPSDPFFWRHYEGPIILVCVRWYLRLPLSYRQVADLMNERGLHVHASCIWRWVQVFGPELDKRCRPHLKPTNKSYRVDETYIKVKGRDRYLYRAVDSTGQTIDFLLTRQARRCFSQAVLSEGFLGSSECSAPRHQRG
jgi:transposase, IS6 family